MSHHSLAMSICLALLFYNILRLFFKFFAKLIRWPKVILLLHHSFKILSGIKLGLRISLALHPCLLVFLFSLIFESITNTSHFRINKNLHFLGHIYCCIILLFEWWSAECGETAIIKVENACSKIFRHKQVSNFHLFGNLTWFNIIICIIFMTK